ncbi:hypothetical protein N7478_012902 [Penicillium angulare]|uniref:uncharacterized protein n=1 Tax=Penicillium angulare TaxID=116970 RepID=UPI00253FDFCC|nr:uncharacterized protein N7478_012902 [Penicillium angulare]KAJ5256798.1 hypothetical protein N7478_012902 [Penicillium angulare]
MGDHTIQSVAVVGAGISGVVSAAHLLASGKNVTIFERNQAAGGVWLYDKRVPIEARYPSLKPSGEQVYVQDNREGKERQSLLHAPPGFYDADCFRPCYESLTNNVSTPLLRTKINSWPEGTLDYVKHSALKNYIQDTSKKSGAHDLTIYGALVTNIHKEGPKWHISWSSLSDDIETNSLVENNHVQTFDAVVIASGHYHTPLVPDIPGLANAKEKWPSKITHSKSFRNTEGFEGKSVLLIGGGVSAMDIAREISSVCQTIYQSTRNGAFDVPASTLPQNVSRIGEIAEFKIHAPIPDTDQDLPITAKTKSGSTIHNIDRIILCTGYQMTLPFLPQYNDNSKTVTAANDTVLVTDGTQFHNLHRDIFYISDPTLAFVGIPFYTATFTLFEFQAIAVAEFFSGNIELPSEKDLRLEYQEKLFTKGNGRSFHSLKGEEENYVKLLLGWVNEERNHNGLPTIEGHTESWVKARGEQIDRLNQSLRKS